MDASLETLRDIYDDLNWQKAEEAIITASMRMMEDPDGYRRKVLERYMKHEQVDSKLCKNCGACCKQAPCHYAPMDFNNGKITYKILKKEIDKGYISIIAEPKEDTDIFTVNKYTYLLRIRGKNRPVSDIAVSVPCGILTENGCMLSYKERPTGGKMFIPRKGPDGIACFSVYDSDMCRKDWLPYQRVLKKLYEFYEKNPI